MLDGGGKREEWTIGLIENVRITDDGMVRPRTIRTSKGTNERPVSKMIIIVENNEEPSNN